jgi:hypothetical protein
MPYMEHCLNYEYHSERSKMYGVVYIKISVTFSNFNQNRNMSKIFTKRPKYEI